MDEPEIITSYLKFKRPLCDQSLGFTPFELVELFKEMRKDERIKEMKAQRLEERNHDWTKDPATESQVLFLKKCQYNGDFKGMTKGEASILIDKYKKDVGGLI
jgi:hypothetical protein